MFLYNEHLVFWSSFNNLEPNALKTVEVTVDFRTSPLPLIPIISQDLKWKNTNSIIKKTAEDAAKAKAFNLPSTNDQLLCGSLNM